LLEMLLSVHGGDVIARLPDHRVTAPGFRGMLEMTVASSRDDENPASSRRSSETSPDLHGPRRYDIDAMNGKACPEHKPSGLAHGTPQYFM